LSCFAAALPGTRRLMPNPSLHPNRYNRLRRFPRSGELKRLALTRELHGCRAIQTASRLDSAIGDGAHIQSLEELAKMSQTLLREPTAASIVFAYLERYHDADLGSPGPLVHYLERAYPPYIDALVASINRRPVSYTLWMTNRILNAKIDEKLRAKLKTALELAARHPLATENERREADEFLQLHN